MNNFFHVMTACKRAIDERACQTMNLIRIVNVGNPNLAGHKIYHQIFTGSSHCHIKPTLASVHYLATYHNLVNAALAKELVVAGKLISLDELQQLMRQLKALDSCTILQDLGIVSNPSSGSGEDEIKDKLDLIIVKESIVNLVKTQGVLGKYILVRSTLAKFPQANSSQVEQLIQQLCHAKQLQIMNPKDKPAKQLVCFIG